MALKPLDLSGQTKTPKKLTLKSEKETDEGVEIEFSEDEDDDEDSMSSWEEILEPVEDSEEDTEGEKEEETEEEDEGSDEEQEDTEADDGDDEDEGETPRGRRENHRVRTLVAEKNAMQATLAAALKEKEETEKALAEFQKNSVQANISLLENHITSIKDRMKKAHEESEFDSIVELQEQLNEAQTQLANQKAWKAPEPKKAVQTTQTQPTKADPFETAPTVLKKWAAKNPWFRDPKSEKDEERQAEALAYADRLMKKHGYELDDPELYEKVDARLNKLGLAKAVAKNVKSNTDKSSTGRKKKISQTVQGASRTSASSSSNKSNNSNKVVLTPEQMQIADLYGITHAEYAREVLRIQNAEKSGRRMITTFDNKK